MKRGCRLLAMLCVAILLVGTVQVYAATSLTATHKATYIKGRFEYASAGNQLMVKLYFSEKHTETGQVYSSNCSATSNGANTIVSKSRNADTGYNYTKLDVYAYLNGAQYSQLLNCPQES